MQDFPPAPPRMEARIEALERLSLTMHARIAEVAQDMKASFQQQAKQQVEAEGEIAARFDAIEKSIETVKSELSGQIAETKQQILDSFQQLITVVTNSQGQQ